MSDTPISRVNPGGFIGALCGLVSGGILGFIINPDATNGMRVGVGAIAGLIIGAMVGNQLWEWVASKFRK